MRSHTQKEKETKYYANGDAWLASTVPRTCPLLIHPFLKISRAFSAATPLNTSILLP